MKPRVFLYLVAQALRNISSNRLVYALGTGTMVASLLIFGTFLLLFVNVNTWIRGWGETLSMSVYLQEGVSASQREAVAMSIEGLPGVKLERFVSKEEALADLKEALGSQAVILEGLSENPLPASYELSLNKGGKEGPVPRDVKEALEALQGVEEVQYSEEWLQRLAGLMNMVQLIGFVIAGLLCMGILFIVTNTVKLTIYSRREEIEIMKLAGATDWFVKIPFLLEGVIQGLAGGLLSLVILFLGYLLLSMKELHFLNFTVLDLAFLSADHILFVLLLSLALGLGGSFIAVGRFFDI